MPESRPSILCGEEHPEFLLQEDLVSIFRDRVAAHPEKPALVFDKKALSYAALDAWSSGIAAFLQEKDVKPGDRIGIWWPRGLELHAAVLGVLKCGAAYVPLDREMPAERVRIVMEESAAVLLLADQDLAACCPVAAVPRILACDPDAWKPVQVDGARDAYVLYTSGSTGTPKGIPITQRSICHFVRAEQHLLQVQPEDRVYQGFSVSFDMWCEETWISILAGATLYVADAETARSVDALSDVLRDWQINVLHAVPSLLGVIDPDIPTLRVINAGGEACPPQVVDDWATGGRRFFNSYGPTETTVSATIAQLRPGEPVSIGAPLPNYNLAVVDESLMPVPHGVRGELVISGPGLSPGYLNRPLLSAEKFVQIPEALRALPGDRMYRSGDAVVLHPDNRIEFQGRIDDQIKLRGYRIELGEIEARLHALTGVNAAAVAVKKDGTEQDTLVGYVVMDDETHFNEQALRVELARRLPSYMVPALIVPLFSMPRLPSGKIDRKALPVPDALLLIAAADDSTQIDLDAPVELRVMSILRAMFPGREIEPRQDFFDDLGGHSLLAAVLVSRLRKDAGVPQASLKDLYLHRPLSRAIRQWEAASAETEARKERPFRPVKRSAWLICNIAQTISLLLIYGLFALQIFLPYLGYYYIYNVLVESSYYDSHPLLAYSYSIGTAFGLFAMMPLFFSAITVAGKWLIIGKMKPGDYPLWGVYYFRWWLTKALARLTPMQYLTGTPLYPTYLRLLGMKVHASAQLSNFQIGAEDLVEIGADVTISSQVVLDNASVEDGWLRLRKIKIGDHAYLGSSAIVGGDAVMDDWAELQDLSHLRHGERMGRAELWQGSPAVRSFTRSDEDLKPPLEVSKGRRRKYRLLFMASLLVFPMFILVPLLPTIITLHQMDDSAGRYDFSYLTVTPSLALAYILIFALQTILVSRLLQRNIRPGVYPLYSALYYRKWLADQLMSLSLIVLHPIFATVYIRSFFRALGAKVGKNTEISTASSVTHPLLKIGSGAFVADAVTLGEADVRGQRLILEMTEIGDVSFVGNSALIPQGYSLPDHMLVGVLSTPPSPGQLEAGNARDFFGSPAIAMPRRQESQVFSDRLTTFPAAHRRIARSLVELVRIIIPETVIICLSVIFIAYGHDLVTKFPLWKAAIGIPLLYLVTIGLPAFFFTAGLKWLLAGRYRSGAHPMWSWSVWRSEGITTTYEALAVPFLLEYLKGTAWLPVMLRLLGVHAGKRVWMNTTDITEYDMVSIGDEAMLNDDCGPQTHLFEDRVMKIGPVRIGARCTVGARTIVLYDTELEEGVSVDALSLVMKGEKLTKGSSWTGSPVRSS
jgi:non-ribosomal peptide synthetase-like protein